jgi:glycosyltransferase involved in cell wall biosynthesis
MMLTMLTATVVITTKNRKDELRTAVKSALMQTASPQVLVIDDGSVDGTSEMIRAEFPQVMLHRQVQSKGLIAQRNQAATLAGGEIIFSIDDDAAFSTPSTVEQTLAEFDHPRVGAVAIPYINVNNEKVLSQRAPRETGIFVKHDYIGTAHALRRDLFLQLGGYHGFLVHGGEEQDYCLRMLNAGYVVRLGRADPIHHFESPRRDFRRMDLYGRRSDLLFVWYNAPWPDFPLHLLGTSFRGVILGFKLGRPLRMIHGLVQGYGAMVHEWSQRKPVSLETFRLMRKLKKNVIGLEEIEGQLQKNSNDEIRMTNQ